MRKLAVKILIPATVVAVVMVVATPALDDLQSSDEAWDIIRLVDRTELAARRFRRDTGRIPIEYGASSADHPHAAKAYHELSGEQLHQGWRGPYLDHPLTLADNPCGGTIELRRDLELAPASGFEFGTSDVGSHGPGNYLLLENVSEEVARLVDQKFDGSSPDGDWARRGRVEYHPASNRALCILLVN
ncbi:MAG: hypothetical protein KDB53_12970 [Planctomycetes bacterium]|nr:hypothetical protein [Planctomycetota bacterium]